MLIEAFSSVLVVIALVIGLKHHQRRQEASRREQLLIQGLLRESTDRPPLNQRSESTEQLEMEILLLHIKTMGEAIVAALAAEAELGHALCTTGNLRNGKPWSAWAPSQNDETLFEQWKMSQKAVEQSHQSYDEAVEQYREFVRSLPLTSRAKAAVRGETIMTAIFI